jgi:hypothetical protein
VIRARGPFAILTSLLAVVGASLSASALASSTVVLSTKFEPNKLGANTTIDLGFDIKTPTGEMPSPLVAVGFRLPAGVVAASSTLGLATCTPATLLEHGVRGCSPESLMGRGSALVGVPIGPGILYERVDMTVLMAPLAGGHTALSFYAVGTSPVIAQLVFPGLLLGDSGAFGARLETIIPLIPGLPGSPDVTLVRMRSSIGSKGLTYYKRVHGTTVAYVPEGFIVPPRCPVGGFPFAASLTFANGHTVVATGTAPCPPHLHTRGMSKRARV